MGDAPPPVERRSGRDRRESPAQTACRDNPLVSAAKDDALLEFNVQLDHIMEVQDWSLERGAAAIGMSPRGLLNLRNNDTDPRLSTLTCISVAADHELRVLLVPRRRTAVR